MSPANRSFFNKNGDQKSGTEKTKSGSTTPKTQKKTSSGGNSFFSGIIQKMRTEPDRSGVLDDTLKGKAQRASRGGEDFFRKSLIYIVGTILLSGFVFCAVFLFSVRGAEKTTVPSMSGSTLAEAQITLQERGLFMELHLRFTKDPKERGLVVAQGVEANTVTKVGRIIPIFVSMGTSVTKIGSYVGRDLDDVLMEVDSFALYQESLMKVEKPILYRYDNTPEGTILEQSPAPGTPVSELTKITLSVSRGPQDFAIPTPDFVGLGYKDAILRVAKTNHNFIFKKGEGVAAGEVVEQSPAKGEDLEPMASLTLTVTAPARIPKGMVWGILNYALPVYEAPVDIRVMAMSPKETNGARLIFGIRHVGGDFSFPYMEPKGTIIMIYAYDKELHRFEVSSD